MKSSVTQMIEAANPGFFPDRGILFDENGNPFLTVKIRRNGETLRVWTEPATEVVVINELGGFREKDITYTARLNCNGDVVSCFVTADDITTKKVTVEPFGHMSPINNKMFRYLATKLNYTLDVVITEQGLREVLDHAVGIKLMGYLNTGEHFVFANGPMFLSTSDLKLTISQNHPFHGLIGEICMAAAEVWLAETVSIVRERIVKQMKAKGIFPSSGTLATEFPDVPGLQLPDGN